MPLVGHPPLLEEAVRPEQEGRELDGRWEIASDYLISAQGLPHLP